jgi:tRNA modification GTPase
MCGDTIVALATPAGVSAMAILRASGSLCEELCCWLIGSDEFLMQTLYHCDYRSVAGEIVDDVMVVFFKGPRSYTGEDAAEIYCHGNMLIVEKILADLCLRGCRLAGPGEFTRRAFTNGKLDLCQAEAVADTIHACSDRALAVARKQLDGALSAKINSIGGNLLNVAAAVEALIDFADDEPREFHASIGGAVEKIEGICGELENLIDGHRCRSVLDGGILTAIVGEPNAGKSSLLNFILGSDRAIVSEIAGTTRDVISERIAIGGTVLRLCDTAGLRDCVGCEIEQVGMERAEILAKTADLFLIVADANSIKPPKLPPSVEKLMNHGNALLIVNKIDLPRNCDLSGFLPRIERFEISLKNAVDSKPLKKKLQAIIAKNELLSCDTDIVVNARHGEILRQCALHLSAAIGQLTNEAAVDRAASDIRQAMEILGEICGTYDVERMLDIVFANFCVGK